jgi:hypothetical protein
MIYNIVHDADVNMTANKMSLNNRFRRNMLEFACMNCVSYVYFIFTKYHNIIFVILKYFEMMKIIA